MVNEREKKQNILIVHNYYQLPGGEDTVVANEKKLLEDYGHKVVLYTRSNNELKNLSIFQKILLPFTTIYNPKTARDVKRIIKEENIDIVHVHNTLTLISPSVYYAALRCKVPVVQTVHNFRLLCPGATFYRDGHICEDCLKKGLGCALKHKCYRNSRMQTLACVVSMLIHRATGIYSKINFICLTEFNKSKLLNLKGVNSDIVYVKPNFTEQKGQLVPAEKRENQFVFAGRLEKIKGIDILLEAWKKLGKDAPRLVVFGTGPLEQESREFAEENNLNVVFKGYASNDVVIQTLSESKALVFPTRCYEGFPMSIIEAFSVGTPVVGSDIGNVSGLIKESINGYKYCNRDELFSGIYSCMRNSEINVLTLQSYTTDYSPETNYDILSKIYDRIG